jgi:hypothetical protein
VTEATRPDCKDCLHYDNGDCIVGLTIGDVTITRAPPMREVLWIGDTWHCGIDGRWFEPKEGVL